MTDEQEKPPTCGAASPQSFFQRCTKAPDHTGPHVDAGEAWFDVKQRIDEIAQKLTELNKTDPLAAEIMALIVAFMLSEFRHVRDRADRASLGIPF